MSNLRHIQFQDLNIREPFFDSLKESYKEFEEWFRRKAKEKAYVLMNERGLLQGFLYLKVESGPIEDVDPAINCKTVLKIGTFKINPHSIKLGERFVKKALDYAVIWKAEACYVTLFEKHGTLKDLLVKYGFERYGIKETLNGKEIVLVKNLNRLQDDLLLDYPLITPEGKRKYLLAIYPEYHTIMFPDSILHNEKIDILDDVSHTNSIHKIYICRMPVYRANRGDIIVVYRTGDGKGPAEYRSVATSICVVEEVKTKEEFQNFEEFFEYANTYSVFDRSNLEYWYNNNECYAIKMTYNAALTKRLTRQKLADEVGINRGLRWSFIELSDNEFSKILELGEVNEGIIID